MKEKTIILPDEGSGFFTRMKMQAFNVFLRLVPLFAKLVLTLYMGRYLSLAGMGEYGLVFGTVMMLTALLGQRFDYVVMREIVGADPVATLHKMRDQALLYMANCLILAIAIFILIISGATNMETKDLIYILLLTIAEGYASLVYVNMNSLNRQVLANVLFFLRAGLWIFPVVALGIFIPSFRTVDVVLGGWFAGIISSYVVVAWVWRKMPWRKAMELPVAWSWLWRGLKKTSLIWLGSIGLACGVYVDRFIVLHFLGMDEVGIITFYASFNTALLALIYSGVSVFAYPRLILYHREGKKDYFRKEARRTGLQVGLSSAVMAAGLGIAVPLLAHYSGHHAYVDNTKVFWLMLVGTWLRANAETFYYILFARHQDKPIWLGNLLFLVPSFGFNALLVPFIGLEGIGYGTIAAAAFLLLWRIWHVFYR